MKFTHHNQLFAIKLAPLRVEHVRPKWQLTRQLTFSVAAKRQRAEGAALNRSRPRFHHQMFHNGPQLDANVLILLENVKMERGTRGGRNFSKFRDRGPKSKAQKQSVLILLTMP